MPVKIFLNGEEKIKPTTDWASDPLLLKIQT
jgi:hypothetical protein